MKHTEIHTLQTQRLLLRKLDMSDVPQFFRHLGSSKTVTEHMLWEPHKDISESAASIQKVLKRYETGSCYRWAITRREDSSLIGIIDLLQFDEAANTCSFAYMLGEAFWGQGYGTEAVEAIFRFAFEELDVHTIVADHFAENPASGAVMRKAGMQYVMTIPQKYEKYGIRHDALEYRITKEVWIQKTRH